MAAVQSFMILEMWNDDVRGDVMGMGTIAGRLEDWKTGRQEDWKTGRQVDCNSAMSSSIQYLASPEENIFYRRLNRKTLKPTISM